MCKLQQPHTLELVCSCSGLGNSWDQAMQGVWQQMKQHVQESDMDYRTASQDKDPLAFSCAIKVRIHTAPLQFQPFIKCHPALTTATL